MVTIREEMPTDVDDIRVLTVSAFSSSPFGYHGEAELLEQLRRDPAYVSCVACLGDKIVGHLGLSKVLIKSVSGRWCGLGLAPLSVDPACQGSGIGSTLISRAMQQLSDSDWQFVVVLGHPEYYQRFSFESAQNYGVSHGFADIPQDVFFLRKLNLGNTEQIGPGAAYYSPAFGPQHTSS